MLSKQQLSSKIAIFGLIALLLFLVQLKFRQWQAQREIEQQKQNLQQQADALQKKNDELNQSLQYLSSSDFKERVAREDLGLKKQGETVYTFGDGQNATSSSLAQAAGNPNPGKWWNYFFESN